MSLLSNTQNYINLHLQCEGMVIIHPLFFQLVGNGLVLKTFILNVFFIIFTAFIR